jgi:high-affinity iron transporter
VAAVIAALLLALREGVEAALVVGIVLVCLERTGRRALARDVWIGVALASLASLAGAVALERLAINQESFEGILMLLAAVFVVTTIVWMSRAARTLKRRIEARVESYAVRDTPGARLGLMTFVFLMVAREGVELVLLLRAVELSSEGLATWFGALLGLGAAIALGLFIFKGTLRVPLPRFFLATGAILMIVALQLALTGLHELSEAMWIPSSRREMAIIGPIVRNDVFFFMAVLGVAAVLVLREWMTARHASAAAPAANPAERRRLEWEQRKERRWLVAAALGCLGVVLALTADFLYARTATAPAPARPLAPEGDSVRIPIPELEDGVLHFYSAASGSSTVRFLAVRKRSGAYAVALDACLICGPSGYRQEGPNVICRNCAAAIYVPSIGDAGGCNPIGVPFRVEGRDLVVALSDLARAVAPGGRR